MNDFSGYKGYQVDFLGVNFKVSLPEISPEMTAFVALVVGSEDNVLHYHHFSLVQHALRRFPIFTAANIDGSMFRKLEREDRWRLDPRIDRNHQWGPELYSAEKSDFDKGHMTKREDTQWGNTEKEAKSGALSTFYYTNAVPQVARLNQQLWQGLENYILKSETIGEGYRINVFTGPVLSSRDPVFITEVEGQSILIPTLFWKIIYFTKSDGSLNRVGFLMGQEALLEEQAIVHPRITERGIAVDEEEELFMNFKQAETCQVNISTIEKLTKLTFTPAIEPYEDDRPVTLIRTEVQGRGVEEGGEASVIIEGLIL